MRKARAIALIKKSAYFFMGYGKIAVEIFHNALKYFPTCLRGIRHLTANSCWHSCCKRDTKIIGGHYEQRQFIGEFYILRQR